MTITTGSPIGVAPPASPVPLPRATNGRSWRAATRTAAATSAPVPREAHRSGRARAPRRRRARTSASSSGSARAATGAERALQVGDEHGRVRHDDREPNGTIDTRAVTPHGTKNAATLDRRRSTPMERRTDRMVRAAREWVTFADPKEEGRRWQIDVTFLLSNWQCIFGWRVPGRAHRARARARARLLLLRRALQRQGRPRPRRAGGEATCATTSGSSPRSAARRASTRRSGKRRRRRRWSGAHASSTTRASS